jgi:hypothetical protein
VEKVLAILTAESSVKAMNIRMKNQPSQLILPEILKIRMEKSLNFMLFINTLKKVVEPKIINLTKLKNVLKLAEMVAKRQIDELFLFAMVIILLRKK